MLSPTLFGVNVDGMSKEIRCKRLGCNIGGINVGIVGYADDTCIILLAPTLQSIYWSSPWPNGYSSWRKRIRVQTLVLELNWSELEVDAAGESGHCVGRGPPSCLV